MTSPISPKTKRAKAKAAAKITDLALLKGQITRICNVLAVTEPFLKEKDAGSRYELYTYLFLAEKLQGKARLSYSSFAPQNAPSGIFRFKCVAAHSHHRYSYYAFGKGSASIRYELRNGVRFKGHNMTHEVDISISTVLGPEPEAARKQLLWAVECKYFDSLTGLKGQMRSSVGAVLDLASCYHLRTGCLLCPTQQQSFFASQHGVGKRQDFLRYLRNYQVTPLFDFHPAGKNRALTTWLLDDFWKHVL
jgi:hypothetical protein